MKDKNITNINIAILKESWKNRNIELNPVKKDKGYIMKIRFIDKNNVVETNEIMHCDADCVYYNCAMYAANYLLYNKVITEEIYNSYIDLLKKLATKRICYS